MVEQVPPNSDDPFWKIRPFSNQEAPEVIKRLAGETELVSALASWQLPILYRYWRSAACAVIRFWLKQKAKRIFSVEDLQNIIAPKLAVIIKKTSHFSVGGLQNLASNPFRLYLSNHRDIVMDPAYANYALHKADLPTLSIAIGDNLLTKPWVGDLMKLNKSFIVRRNVSGPRAMLAASKLLAQYIRHSIENKINPIWIAHREGRAKDGVDQTEPAVIKMLSMARYKHESAKDALDAMRIVPLIISYELDPCDYLKAAELAAGKSYTKKEFEDVGSIAKGITEYKGCVHLQFGEAIPRDSSVANVVELVDEQMITHYELFQTNLWAWEWLNGGKVPHDLRCHQGSISKSTFQSRVNDVVPEHRQFMLAMYANPVVRLLDYRNRNRVVDH